MSEQANVYLGSDKRQAHFIGTRSTEQTIEPYMNAKQPLMCNFC